MGLFAHKFIYCSQKTLLLKLNEQSEISFRLVKNYTDETFVENLRLRRFPNFLYNACLNDTYQDFVTKFLSAVDSVASVRT